RGVPARPPDRERAGGLGPHRAGPARLAHPRLPGRRCRRVRAAQPPGRRLRPLRDRAAPAARPVDRRRPQPSRGEPAHPPPSHQQPPHPRASLRSSQHRRAPRTTVRPTTVVGHRALSQRTRRFREITDDLRALVADMFETTVAADGAGLAAPQVGARWRLFVYSCPDAEGTLRRGVVLNPVLERFGGIVLDEETLEGCLSVPGEGFPTARHRGARVTGIDLEGQEVRVEDEGGVLARALQPEVDHLDGSLYLDRLSPARRREALDAVRDRGWRSRGILTWDPREMDAADV